MLARFDMIVNEMLQGLSNRYDGLMDKKFLEFCRGLEQPRAMQCQRDMVLRAVSQELRNIYGKPVFVLINDYDTPMRSAIEYDYATAVCSLILLYPSQLILFQANDFFSVVFSSLLKVCQHQCLRHC